MPVDIVFDCETNGLLETVDRIHCVCGIERRDGVDFPFEYGPDDIETALARLSSADRLIGHNILRYDLPMLKKVCGWEPRKEVIIRDTKVIARLKHPNVNDTDAELIANGKMPGGRDYRGKHTIAAWGYRLGLPKLHEDITDWSQWTRDMQERCAGDAATNLRLWDYLRADDYSQEAISLEQRIDVLVWRMEEAGVPFDVAAAGKLHVKLLGKREELERALVTQFGSWLAPDGPHEGLRTPKRDRVHQGAIYTEGAPYTKLKTVTFNPQSRQQIEKVLRDRGWAPTEHTPSGQAKIDEQVIDTLARRFPEIAGLGELMMVNKRLGQLAEGDSALLKCVGADGRIHGAINPMGTQTSRGSHFKPNLAQVPSSKSPYGDRFRGLFRVPDDWVLVGADQDGLEGRGLAHYLAAFDGGSYGEILLKGDPHWASTVALGFVGPGTSRDKHDPLHVVVREGSKTFYYAFVYGAQAKKAGEIILDICLRSTAIGHPELYSRYFRDSKEPQKLLGDVGGKARKKFAAGIKGLDKLTDRAQQQVKQFGALRGLDGRIIPARGQHAALNYLIQSAGAILCKRWIVDAFDEIISRGYRHGWAGDFVFCLWIHDEVQVACREGLQHEIGEILVRHAKAVGSIYKFRVPLDSKYSVGRSWADTH